MPYGGGLCTFSVTRVSNRPIDRSEDDVEKELPDSRDKKRFVASWSKEPMADEGADGNAAETKPPVVVKTREKTFRRSSCDLGFHGETITMSRTSSDKKSFILQQKLSHGRYADLSSHSQVEWVSC